MIELFQNKRDAFPPQPEERKGSSMRETRKQQPIPVKVYRTGERKGNAGHPPACVQP